MKLLTGVLYILTGLVVTFCELIITGAMLGFTTPILSLRNTLTSGLYSLGPSTLILAGLAIIFDKQRRGVICAIGSCVIITGLAFWSAPRIGWLYASQLIVEPTAISMFIGSIVIVKIKRIWISAAIASGLSSPFFVFGAAYYVYEYAFGTVTPSLLQVYVFVPAVLVIFSFVSALRFRWA